MNLGFDDLADGQRLNALAFVRDGFDQAIVFENLHSFANRRPAHIEQLGERVVREADARLGHPAHRRLATGDARRVAHPNPLHRQLYRHR